MAEASLNAELARHLDEHGAARAATSNSRPSSPRRRRSAVGQRFDVRGVRIGVLAVAGIFLVYGIVLLTSLPIA